MVLPNMPWSTDRNQEAYPRGGNTQKGNTDAGRYCQDDATAQSRPYQNIDVPLDADYYPAPGAAKATGAALTEEQTQLLRDLLKNINGMEQLVLDYEEEQALIQNQIEIKDGLINKLHAELDAYKQESSGRFEDQLMKAVIRVRIAMLRTLSSKNWSEKSADEVRKEFVGVFDDLTDLLELQNIEPYHSDPGTPFDKSIHQKAGTMEPTDDLSLDKTVRRTLTEGYRKGDRVLVAERVVLQQYTAPQPTE